MCIAGHLGLDVVQVWNLTTGEQLGSFRAGTLAKIASCVEVDGNAVTAVATMRTLRRWNVATNEVSLLVAERSEAPPTAATTMMVDGAPLAIAALDQGDLYIWDLTDPRGPGQLLGRHPGATRWPDEVTSLHGARADGRPVAVAVGAGRGSVWDLRAGTKLHDGFAYPVGGLSIEGTPATVLDVGGESMVLVSAQSRVMAFDVNTGAPSDLIVPGDLSGNFAAAEVNDVPYLFTVDDVGGLAVRNLTEHGSLPNHLPLEFHVRSLDCTTVGGRPLLVVAGQTRIAGHREFTTQIKLFDAAEIVAAATEPPSPAIFSAARVTTAAGERILAGSTDGSLHLFEPGTGARRPLPAGASHGRVYPVLATGDTAIAAVLDGPLQRWNVENARTVGAPFTAHPGRILAMTTFVDDGRTTVVTGQDCAELHFWDPATGEEAGPSMTHQHGSGGVNALITFELAGATVLATGGAGDSTVRLWRPRRDGMRLDRAVKAQWLTVGALAAVTVDGQPMLVSGGGLDGQISTWNPLSGARVWGPVTTNRMGVHSIVPARFRGTPALLTGGFYSTEVGIWSMLTGARLGALTTPSPVNGILFGSDAVLVLQSGQDLITLTPPPFLEPEG
ncbi:WD40 repeat domain-containing protein [Micromonospora sp. DT31]|uniref:WD40 repeat domain-containing protein n=1 Tax=Micromonospora sp. DT31 TaxID=3393434 RepID=UPI003CF2A698